MARELRFEHNGPMSACHLSVDGSPTGFVFCSIPGGRPQFAIDAKRDRMAFPVSDGPQCDSHKEFVAFCKGRWPVMQPDPGPVSVGDWS